MINFYNYFNFFFFDKKFILNILNYLFIFNKKNFDFKKNILKFITYSHLTKIDIKNFIEYFFGINISKINTLFLKKSNKKKVFIYFNEFI